jgi:hypothetical protein
VVLSWPSWCMVLLVSLKLAAGEVLNLTLCSCCLSCSAQLQWSAIHSVSGVSSAGACTQECAGAYYAQLAGVPRFWICAVVHAHPCRWGTVVQILTPAGTITLDDTEITFSEDSA